MERRPNILFLMSDEHRPDVAGFAGDDIVRTPTLDSLAATGTIFRNAYTPSPICIPGRQSLATGQFPSTTGCRVFGDDLAPGSMTFARRFAQYAYETVACGKLHHTGTDQMQGWTKRVSGDISITPQNVPDRVDAEFEKHTFPTSSVKWSDAKEIARAGVGRSPVVVDDEYCVQGALHFIDEYFTSPYYDRAQAQRPLMLKVSLKAPHYPYLTSEQKFTHYLNRVEPFMDQELPSHPVLSRRRVTPGVDTSERDIRRTIAAYFGMIETIDEQFGQIIEGLRHVGQNLDDWIIVYTSDHGEMLGEHGIWEKQRFYEASARVPLIVRYPARFAGNHTVQQNVNLCDLFATLCDLAGIPAPPDLDSRSLVPLMEGDATSWDNETISQFGLNDVMVKRDALKYQWYGQDLPEVLFDLERDPTETVDYASDPDYHGQMERFRQRRAELGYGTAVPQA